MDKLIKDILTSKVYEVVAETPLDYARSISEKIDNKVSIKREDLQSVFSFKIRGAYNKIAHLTEDECKSGVIAASAGNHAQGVAYSAMRKNIKATIVMPLTTPEIKINAVKRFGAEVILHGDSYSDAADHCKNLVEKTGMTFVHPFNDDLVIAGQGTIALEILRQSKEKVDAVFIPIGGGGLAAGMASYIKAISPDTKVIGVEPQDSNAMKLSIEKEHRVTLDNVGIFADGVAVKKVGNITYKLCKKYLDDIVLVNSEEICSAIKLIYQDTRAIAEPAGALATAGVVKYVEQSKVKNKNFVTINSGANMNFERLSYIADNAGIGEKNEILYAVKIPEETGSLRRFCLDVVGESNISEFSYRLTNRDSAIILIGLKISDDKEKASFIKKVKESGFEYEDISENDLAKLHLRYMVGGKFIGEEKEKLYRFLFPERKGALKCFLECMNSNWNLSLFNYRMQGIEFASVLIGLEVPKKDEASFQTFLKKLGYKYKDESENQAYRLFL